MLEEVLAAADFVAEADFEAVEDFLEEVLQFELQEQLETCSKAKDQKYSSLPCGQPAFCQL